MKKNMGSAERVIRLLAGLGIVSMAFVGPHSPWAFLGIIPVFTALMGWCPSYALLGITTCKGCK